MLPASPCLWSLLFLTPLIWDFKTLSFDLYMCCIVQHVNLLVLCGVLFSFNVCISSYGQSIERMSIEELEQGKEWLNETFHLIR